MRIAMLTNNYKPFVGGVPISVERQAEELVKLGHEVTVFAPEYEGCKQEEQEPNKERIIRCRSSKRKMENGMVYPGLISTEMLQVFERERFDCIHTHHPMFVGPMALHLAKRYQLPVIYTYHTKYEDYLHYLPCFQGIEKKGALRRWIFHLAKEKVVPAYMKWFTNQCDLVLAPTASMQRLLRNSGTKTSTAVFPTGLKDSFFLRDEEKIQTIRQTYLQGRTHLFCTVSRLEQEKNPMFLLQGIAKLKEKMEESFRVLFVGDGSMREQLEKMAGELGITEEIIFLGNVGNEEIKNYVGASELFLFASKSETQGIVLAEAFAAGCPVIAVDATGVEDVVVDGMNGYKTKESVEEWTEKIIEALHPKLYKELQIQAELTAASFSSSKLAVYEEMLYVQCIEKKRREGETYEIATSRSGDFSTSVQRLFKTS